MGYIFTSERLGFRTWQANDLSCLRKLNGNERVMEYFPGVSTQKQDLEFISRMQNMFSEKGYCYFPVELKRNNEFIGFIGLAFQDYKSEFTPAIDIGWRILPDFWGNGYATEGAKMTLKYAKEELHIREIISVAPILNKDSIEVMRKIGMKHKFDFLHPMLSNHKKIEQCSLYDIRL